MSTRQAFLLLGLCLVLAPLARPCAADKGADLKALDEAIKRVTPVATANPKQAVAEWTRFLQERPDVDPSVAVVVGTYLTDLHLYRLNDAKAAAEICDAQIPKCAESPFVICAVGDRAKVFVAQKNGADAEALCEKYWELYPQTFWIHANKFLYQYCLALEQQGKNARVPALITRGLREFPQLLDEGMQAPNGWAYERMIRCLIAENEVDQALQWAKLRFVTCTFDTAAIERCTRSLMSAWTAKDPSQQAAKAFADAQKDPAKTNPLAAVPLPEVDAEARKKIALRGVAGSPAAEFHARITLALFNGAVREAMTEARYQMIDSPDSPAGVQEICRVLKAADCGVARANAFIDFVKTGNGANPLDAFFKEHPASK